MSNKGLTLIEVLVGTFVFLLIALAVYQSYSSLIQLAYFSKTKMIAMMAVAEEIEMIRNLPYEDVGIISGIPAGILEREKVVTKSGINFLILTSVRNIDNPFDGTIDSDPPDLSPADYRQVEIAIGCLYCNNFSTTTVTTTVAPKNLETIGVDGSLFVKVINSNGQPVSGADINIINNEISPVIDIKETSDINGLLQLVGAPPGNFAYEIEVSKAGYSREKTYSPDDPDNPNPLNLHSTVLTGQLTQITLTIDELATASFKTISENCQPIGGVSFDLAGSKLIGSDPDVLKYNQTLTTDAGGQRIVTNLDSDIYNLYLNDSDKFLAGSLPLLPLYLNPGSWLDTFLIVKEKNPNALLVTVRDGSSNLALSGASVSLSGIGELTTNRGYLRQTDWSGGAGQSVFSDLSRYFESGGIDDGSIGEAPAGELKLLKVAGEYQPDGYLISSIFDTYSASTSFYNLNWQSTGGSASTIRFQLASSNDVATTTWQYLGPDGSPETFFTINNNNIGNEHDNQRYIRYKLYLSTNDFLTTPAVSDISITYSSECMPFGQVFFDGLSAGNYFLNVSKSGYSTFIDEDLLISNLWSNYEIVLLPE